MILINLINIFAFQFNKSHLFNHKRSETPNPNNVEVSLNEGSAEHNVRNMLPGCRSGKCPRPY